MNTKTLYSFMQAYRQECLWPNNLMNLIMKRARMEGFIVIDYVHRSGEAIKELVGWIDAGELISVEDVQEGLENAPLTLQRLFTGANLGKQLLKIAEPPIQV